MKSRAARAGFYLAVILVFLAAAGFSTLWIFVKKQGLSSDDLRSLAPSEISISRNGVLTVKASTWIDLIEAQGFAAAGERMFQMDLMRRKADGTLSEIFGPDALVVDRPQILEDWRYYASKAYEGANETQRATCDAYARGVNRFISGHRHTAGIEYKILRSEPRPWTCVDTYLIAMLLSDQMSRSWSRDLDMAIWHDRLPPDWFQFVFPTRHPWNQIVFGEQTGVTTRIPAPLPAKNLADDDFQMNPGQDIRGLNGSNSWAYRGKSGFWLANDPHLANSVPQMWIPFKLATSDGWWATGVAVPGVPGILIGMNSSLAWSITNTAEDIDDAVYESPDNITQRSTRTIKVKNAPEERLEARKTPRGPVVKDLADGRVVARQWMVQKAGNLILPIYELTHAADWDSFNSALDQFKFVALSFTMLDSKGNMGLRITGCDYIKQNNGAWAESWETSGWSETCATATRRRIYKPNDGKSETDFIATANERLWDDGKIHNWADDDRSRRIRESLSGDSSLTIEAMRLLQLDTYSRFHKNLLMWVMTNAETGAVNESLGKAWNAWNGDVTNCAECMSVADDIYVVFDQLILKRVSSAFASEDNALPLIRREMKRARVVAAIENADVIPSLGLDKKSLASGLAKFAARRYSQGIQHWQNRNQWNAQHPFVGRIPVFDKLFAIKPWPQFGAAAAVRAERPNHGPSMRIIFKPGDPDNSLWSFPVGTSGHILSGRYENWSLIWQNGGMATPP